MLMPPERNPSNSIAREAPVIFSPRQQFIDRSEQLDAFGIFHSLDDAVTFVHSHELAGESDHHHAGNGNGNANHHTVSTATKTSKTTCQRLHSRSISDAHSLCNSSSILPFNFPSFSGRAAANKARRLRIRPLMALVSQHNISAFDPEPDSPPELTSSKSSKSSSFRTSSSLAESASPHDPSHFEDITLDDFHGSVSHGIYGADAPALELHISDKENFRRSHGHLPLPKARSAHSSISSIRSSGQSSATTVPGRDLTNTQRPVYPSLKGQINGALPNGRATQSALHLPVSKSPRRGVTSPVNPHFSAPPFPPPSSRSRSPSPTFLQSFGLSQRAPRRSSSRSSLHSTSTIAPITRRSSWQPGRKTVKQLEDEYDDLDEDIPEDAVVWNVPLSPRPGHSRSVSQSPDKDASVPPTPLTVPLPRTMTLPEPERQPQSGSLHTLRRQRSTPAILEDPENSSLKPRPSPRPSRRSSPRRPSPLQSVTDLSKIHDIQAYGKPRTKSYGEAMSDLSNEARHITAALEALERSQSTDIPSTATSDTNASSFSANSKTPSSTSTPITPEIEQGETFAIRKTPSGKTIVTLPPVRKGDIMIDPLPISKEKEKVLTRTRPSWLPPKDQKEEKRHLKEYRRMMEASLEAEKKRAARLAAEQEARDAATSSLLKIWESYVIPSWTSALAEPRTRELWWRGVPSQHRPEVWMRAVGNELQLTETSYNAALTRAKDEETRLETLQSQLVEGDNLKGQDQERWNWFERMRAGIQSLSREQEWSSFLSDPSQSQHLREVLMAYAFYRSDVGYVTPLHQIAALFLHANLSPSESFILLANFLNRPLPMAYLLTTLRFRSNAGSDLDAAAVPIPPAISNSHALVLKTLAYKLPSLHVHLTSPNLGLHPSEYLDPILSTFFTDERIGIERATRTWDILAFEGDKVLVRAAVAVLAKLEGRLYGSREEVLRILGWGSRPQWGGDLGSVEEWVTGLREAGKVDKRDD